MDHQKKKLTNLSLKKPTHLYVFKVLLMVIQCILHGGLMVITAHLSDFILSRGLVVHVHQVHGLMDLHLHGLTDHFQALVLQEDLQDQGVLLDLVEVCYLLDISVHLQVTQTILALLLVIQITSVHLLDGLMDLDLLLVGLVDGMKANNLHMVTTNGARMGVAQYQTRKQMKKMVKINLMRLACVVSNDPKLEV
jgi:hypothetical protein